MAGNSRRLGLALKIAGVLLFALVAGGASAWWAVSGLFARGDIASGPWRTNAQIGSAEAGAYLRAGVSIAGLLALNKSETLYYTATSDSQGRPLASNCLYYVEGVDPPARWWSITAYGGDHYLIANEGKRYSLDMTRARRGADGAWVILLGGPADEGNWIATGDAAASAPFSLTLRLYNPAPEVVDDPGRVELPAIRKESCS